MIKGKQYMKQSFDVSQSIFSQNGAKIDLQQLVSLLIQQNSKTRNVILNIEKFSMQVWWCNSITDTITPDTWTGPVAASGIAEPSNLLKDVRIHILNHNIQNSYIQYTDTNNIFKHDTTVWCLKNTETITLGQDSNRQRTRFYPQFMNFNGQINNGYLVGTVHNFNPVMQSLYRDMDEDEQADKMDVIELKDNEVLVDLSKTHSLLLKGEISIDWQIPCSNNYPWKYNTCIIQKDTDIRPTLAEIYANKSQYIKCLFILPTLIISAQTF